MSEIKETILGGWKGTLMLSVLCVLCSMISFVGGNLSASMAFMLASLGWCGWGIQELQHLRCCNNKEE